MQAGRGRTFLGLFFPGGVSKKPFPPSRAAGLGGGLRGGVDEESLWVEFSPNRMVCLSVCIYKSLKMLEDLGPGTFLSSYRLAAKRTKQKRKIFT